MILIIFYKEDVKGYSDVGKETIFRVYLPLMKKSTDAVSTEKALNKLTGTERILLVDDEESFVKSEMVQMVRKVLDEAKVYKGN